MAFFLIRTTPIHLSKPIMNVIFIKCCPTHEKKCAHFPLFFHEASLFPLSCSSYSVTLSQPYRCTGWFNNIVLLCMCVFMYTYVYVLIWRVVFNFGYSSSFFYIILWDFHIMYPVLLPPSLSISSTPLTESNPKECPPIN